MDNSYLIAAGSSGSGKTTVSIGLMRLLSQQGIKVQPFKCGPDYLDPIFHKIACGTPSYNLDLWMNGYESCINTFCRHNGEINIVEGAMGLFDGRKGFQGSAADIAELLDIPIILVVDARSMAQSVAPLLYGFKHYRPSLKYAGVLFNNVGSKRHLDMLCKAAEEVCMPVAGWLTRQDALYTPSRHLGLDISEVGHISVLADEIAKNLQLNISLNKELAYPKPAISEILDSDVQIYIAKDEAFNFIYQESLELMEKLGKLHFFSPLANEEIPENANYIYLPGGYPEFYLEQLSKSTDTIRSLKATKAKIIAECGGMMYLGQNIDGYKMTGLLPFSTTMQGARLHLGYRNLKLSNGEYLRGHEFHYSTITAFNKEKCENVLEQEGTILYIHENVRASYTHWGPESLIKLMTL